MAAEEEKSRPGTAPRGKILLKAQEVTFVKALAGNSKELRDRALRRLKKWFKARSQGTFLFTEEDFMRLWKGLFYSMWMSDKPLIQEELAESISDLVHSFSLPKQSFLFVRCFFLTMGLEWFGLDQLRLNKFLMLVRRFLRQSLVLTRNLGWDRKMVKKLNSALRWSILSTEVYVPLGLLSHFLEIYLEELAKIGREVIPPKTVTLLLQPFMVYHGRCTEANAHKLLTTHIVDQLIDQHDIAFEYRDKFEAWKRAGYPGDGPEDMEKVEDEEVSGGEGGGGEGGVAETNERMIRDHAMMHGTRVSGVTAALDPRAGNVNVVLPQIPFDPRDISAMVLNESKKAKNKRGQRALFKQSKKFSTLAKGRYPFAKRYAIREAKEVAEIKQARLDRVDSLWEAVTQLEEFEHELGDDDRKVELPKTREQRRYEDRERVRAKKRKMKQSADDDTFQKFVDEFAAIPKKSREEDDPAGEKPTRSALRNAKRAKLREEAEGKVETTPADSGLGVIKERRTQPVKKTPPRPTEVVSPVGKWEVTPVTATKSKKRASSAWEVLPRSECATSPAWEVSSTVEPAAAPRPSGVGAWEVVPSPAKTPKKSPRAVFEEPGFGEVDSTTREGQPVDSTAGEDTRHETPTRKPFVPKTARLAKTLGRGGCDGEEDGTEGRDVTNGVASKSPFQTPAREENENNQTSAKSASKSPFQTPAQVESMNNQTSAKSFSKSPFQTPAREESPSNQTSAKSASKSPFQTPAKVESMNNQTSAKSSSKSPFQTPAREESPSNQTSAKSASKSPLQTPAREESPTTQTSAKSASKAPFQTPARDETTNNQTPTRKETRNNQDSAKSASKSPFQTPSGEENGDDQPCSISISKTPSSTPAREDSTDKQTSAKSASKAPFQTPARDETTNNQTPAREETTNNQGSAKSTSKSLPSTPAREDSTENQTSASKTLSFTPTREESTANQTPAREESTVNVAASKSKRETPPTSEDESVDLVPEEEPRGEPTPESERPPARSLRPRISRVSVQAQRAVTTVAIGAAKKTGKAEPSASQTPKSSVERRDASPSSSQSSSPDKPSSTKPGNEPETRQAKSNDDDDDSDDSDFSDTALDKKNDVLDDGTDSEQREIVLRNNKRIRSTPGFAKLATRSSRGAASSRPWLVTDAPDSPKRSLRLASKVQPVTEDEAPPSVKSRLRGKNKMDAAQVCVMADSRTASKRVNIQLARNSSYNLREYHQALVTRPGVPYDAERRPSVSVLRNASETSPVNPFYSLKKIMKELPY